MTLGTKTETSQQNHQHWLSYKPTQDDFALPQNLANIIFSPFMVFFTSRGLQNHEVQVKILAPKLVNHLNHKNLLSYEPTQD